MLCTLGGSFFFLLMYRVCIARILCSRTPLHSSRCSFIAFFIAPAVFAYVWCFEFVRGVCRGWCFSLQIPKTLILAVFDTLLASLCDLRGSCRVLITFVEMQGLGRIHC